MTITRRVLVSFAGILLLASSLAFGQLSLTGAGRGVVAAPGGGSTPAWVQMTASIQGGGSSTPTINYPVTTTNGNTIGIVFATFSNAPSAVVGNLSGGGTVALTQRATYNITVSSEDVYVYTVDAAAPVTSITITLAGFANPVAILFEASSATYDTSAISNTLSSASEHTVSATTTGTDDLVGVYGYIASSSISTVHSGYTQVGSTNGGYYSLQNNSATGSAGSKTSGQTPAASTSSGQVIFALKGA